MNTLSLFLPCAAGVEPWLMEEVQRAVPGAEATAQRGGVSLVGDWRAALALNLHSRLAQRVLVQLAHAPYRSEQDLYRIASEVAWEIWFTPRQSFKIEVTAQHSPLKSLNFAALKLKDAVADRFRARAGGVRPDVDTRWPDVRIHAHLSAEALTLYIDTTGEPLFKRGWREDKGEAPLKETLAAALLAASGWTEAAMGDAPAPTLYDPCCGSGTIAIEAAQIACRIAPGSQRRFAFEKLLPHRPETWTALRQQALAAQRAPAPGVPVRIFGSDVAHRMVDFAQRNAQRAGVAQAIEFRGGDALQRLPPTPEPGLLLLNPPYGERIATAGVAGAHTRGRERAQSAQGGAGPPQASLHPLGGPGGRQGWGPSDDEGDFFVRLATHWKQHFAGWSAWVLTPELKLGSRMRLKESRRIPMWNGPIECRLLRFDMVRGSARS